MDLKRIAKRYLKEDPLDEFVRDNLKRTSGYSQDISEYLAKVRSRQRISDSDRLRYSNAYAYQAWLTYGKNDTQGAFRSISRALKLAPKNPVALFIAGGFSERSCNYSFAVGYYFNASRVGEGSVRDSSEKRLDAIASGLIEEATNLAKSHQFIEADKRLAFVSERFAGSRRAEALKLRKEYRDEIVAMQMLQKAQQLLSMRRRGDAQRLLKQITQNYSWTRAAEEAQKILRKSDTLYVRAKADSTFAEIAAKQKWKVLETENFLIYYRNNDFAKEAAKIIEMVFRRTVADLDLKNVRWKTKKCKIFLFDDNDTWSKFKKLSRFHGEWAAAFASPTSREIFGNAAEGKRLLHRTLPHELTHLIHHEYAGERTAIPIWLSEGLAMHQQFDSKLAYYLNVHSAIYANQHLSLELLLSYTNYPSAGKIGYFYAESLTFVEFIIKTYGRDAFAKINRDVKHGKGKDMDLKRIAKRYLKEDPQAVDRKWKRFIAARVETLRK